MIQFDFIPTIIVSRLLLHPSTSRQVAVTEEGKLIDGAGRLLGASLAVDNPKSQNRALSLVGSVDWIQVPKHSICEFAVPFVSFLALIFSKGFMPEATLDSRYTSHGSEQPKRRLVTAVQRQSAACLSVVGFICERSEPSPLLCESSSARF